MSYRSSLLLGNAIVEEDPKFITCAIIHSPPKDNAWRLYNDTILLPLWLDKVGCGCLGELKLAVDICLRMLIDDWIFTL